MGDASLNHNTCTLAGGWCTSLEDCYGRSKTALGSSTSYKATTDAWSVRDVLKPDCGVNPAFCNWTTVYQPYCDGASRAGDAADPVVVSGEALYFRGFKVLESMLHALLQPAGANPSLADATQVLISGSSAGGLTTLLHADFIADAIHAANPAAVVKAVPEVGFFIDGQSVWGGQHIMTSAYRMVAGFSNITTGAPEQVNAGCMDATAPTDRWQCFMAQYTYPHIKTPVFLLNSMVDEWQTSNILAPNSNYSVSVTPYEAFQPCIKDPTAGCNATQAGQWTGYATQFTTALDAALAATPASSAAQNGGFITTCPIHTTAIDGLSHRITIGGVTMYEALVAWFFQTNGQGGKQYWTYDVAVRAHFVSFCW